MPKWFKKFLKRFNIFMIAVLCISTLGLMPTALAPQEVKAADKVVDGRYQKNIGETEVYGHKNKDKPRYQKSTKTDYDRPGSSKTVEEPNQAGFWSYMGKQVRRASEATSGVRKRVTKIARVARDRTQALKGVMMQSVHRTQKQPKDHQDLFQRTDEKGHQLAKKLPNKLEMRRQKFKKSITNGYHKSNQLTRNVTKSTKHNVKQAGKSATSIYGKVQEWAEKKNHHLMTIVDIVCDFVGIKDAYTLITGKDWQTGREASRVQATAWLFISLTPAGKLVKAADLAGKSDSLPRKVARPGRVQSDKSAMGNGMKHAKALKHKFEGLGFMRKHSKLKQ